MLQSGFGHRQRRDGPRRHHRPRTRGHPWLRTAGFRCAPIGLGPRNIAGASLRIRFLRVNERYHLGRRRRRPGPAHRSDPDRDPTSQHSRSSRSDDPLAAHERSSSPTATCSGASASTPTTAVVLLHCRSRPRLRGSSAGIPSSSRANSKNAGRKDIRFDLDLGHTPIGESVPTRLTQFRYAAALPARDRPDFRCCDERHEPRWVTERCTTCVTSGSARRVGDGAPARPARAVLALERGSRTTTGWRGPSTPTTNACASSRPPVSSPDELHADMRSSACQSSGSGRTGGCSRISTIRSRRNGWPTSNFLYQPAFEATWSAGLGAPGVTIRGGRSVLTSVEQDDDGVDSFTNNARAPAYGRREAELRSTPWRRGGPSIPIATADGGQHRPHPTRNLHVRQELSATLAGYRSPCQGRVDAFGHFAPFRLHL